MSRDAATFARLRDLRERRSSDGATGAAAYERLRDELIVRHLGLAHHLASKFADRGEPLSDLVQVAAVGLINAIDRFDESRGAEFSTFATPTIMGEIKRHFRDRGWAIKAPRRLRELNVSIARAVDDLTVRLGRTPTIAEIADRTGFTSEDIIRAREVASAASVLSLDAGSSDEDRPSIGESVGAVEAELESLIERTSLERALQILPGRERMVVMLHFFDGLSQSEIARRLSVSQMQISRVQSRALARLRSHLAGGEGREAVAP